MSAVSGTSTSVSVFGAGHVASQRRVRRRVADAARVEDLQRKRERVDAFEKERPLLGQERLEVGQVQDQLIRLDLREVRNEGRVQRHVVGDVPFEIQSRRSALVVAVRHMSCAASRRRRRRAEREQLKRPPPFSPRRSSRLPEARRRRDVAREVGPKVGLLPVGDEARGLHAPALHGQAAVEAQDAERDPDLRGPAAGAARGLPLPVLVPLPRGQV